LQQQGIGVARHTGEIETNKYYRVPPDMRRSMSSGLEDKVSRNASGRFRSEGEKRIAAALDQYGIPFVYEQKVTVNDNGKIRTLRPDFYLPEFNLYIEYYGRVTNHDYDIRTAKKKAAYAANKLHVISLYPWDLIQDWPNYLFERLAIPPNHYPLKSPNRRYNPAHSKSRYAIRSPSAPRHHHSPRSSYR